MYGELEMITVRPGFPYPFTDFLKILQTAACGPGSTPDNLVIRFTRYVDEVQVEILPSHDVVTVLTPESSEHLDRHLTVPS